MRRSNMRQSPMSPSPCSAIRLRFPLSKSESRPTYAQETGRVRSFAKSPSSRKVDRGWGRSETVSSPSTCRGSVSLDECRWNAIQRCDVRAAGTFVYGRVSEGSYHSPICRQRPGDREEVVFFDTAEAASEAGLTPCSQCYPDQAGWLRLRQVDGCEKCIFQANIHGGCMAQRARHGPIQFPAKWWSA